MKLTQNFNLSEFACKDGTPVPEEKIERIQILAEQLQVLRNYLEKPIRINSAYRTEEYNRQIGGVSNSQHVQCNAADIVAVGLDAKQVQDAIEYLITAGKMQQGGLGRYASFTHYDIRGYRARWEG